MSFERAQGHQKPGYDKRLKRRNKEEKRKRKNHDREEDRRNFLSPFEVERIVKVTQELSEEITSDLGLELIDVSMFRKGRRWVLRVTINRPGGTSIRDCEMVSRRLERKLDILDLIPHSYLLEVQSKGIEI